MYLCTRRVMPVIAIVNQKGGTGKTTLATNLAAAFAETGRVLLLDADAQGSSHDWADSQGQARVNLDVRAADPARLLQDARRLCAEYDWVIIDGPAGISRITADAVRAADVVLIPAKPSPFDVWAASTIVDAVKARRATSHGLPKAAFVITMAKTRTLGGSRSRRLWRSMDCRRWSPGRPSGSPTPRWPSRVSRCWTEGTELLAMR